MARVVVHESRWTPRACDRLDVVALLRAATGPPRGADALAAAGDVVHEDSLVTGDSVRLYYRSRRDRARDVSRRSPSFTRRGSTRWPGAASCSTTRRGRGRSAGVPQSKVSLSATSATSTHPERRGCRPDRLDRVVRTGDGVVRLRAPHPDRVTRLVAARSGRPPLDAVCGAHDGRSRAAHGQLGIGGTRGARGRGEFTGKPDAECRARAAVNQPATFGDPARPGWHPTCASTRTSGRRIGATSGPCCARSKDSTGGTRSAGCGRFRVW